MSSLCLHEKQIGSEDRNTQTDRNAGYGFWEVISVKLFTVAFYVYDSWSFNFRMFNGTGFCERKALAWDDSRDTERLNDFLFDREMLSASSL